MYPWQLGPGDRAPVDPWLVELHESRRQMIEGHVREALSAAGPQATVLDLGCGEGWFSHLALEWGAARVVGWDARELNIRRAHLIADQFGLSADRLRFEQADVSALRPGELDTFDIVLNLDLVCDLEDPAEALRAARSACRSLHVVDTLLTPQAQPLEWFGLTATEALEEAGMFAIHVERAGDRNPLSSTAAGLRLIPNARAVEQMAEVAGFADCERLEPPLLSHPMYVDGHRGLFLARVAWPAS